MINTTVILSGETLFDVAIRKYGHMQGIAQLAKDNGISLTGEAIPGSDLKVDESVNYDLPEVVVSEQTEIAPNEVVVETWQNIFDMSIQLYGDLSGLEKISKDNQKSLTSELMPGDHLKARTESDNKLVVDYLIGQNAKPATGLTPQETEELKPEGIEYWAIEVDFVVS